MPQLPVLEARVPPATEALCTPRFCCIMDAMPARRKSPRSDPREAEPSETAMRILAVIRRIPSGHVATYGQVAELAGLPGRARLVGHVLRTSPLADEVPWHRVLTAAGKIAERGAGESAQRRRLLAEGIRFDSRGRVNLARHRWKRRADNSAK